MCPFCRLFLSPYDLTPTYKDVHNKFSVRYFLNLVLVDEEDRRYFKQQEITLYRKDENAPQQPPAVAPPQPQQQQPVAQQPQQQQPLQEQPEVQAAPAPVEQPAVFAPVVPPAQPKQSHEPLMFADEPPQQQAEATPAAAESS
jgi:vacuolar protein sorting-associated protein 26